jgi:hypothetical protein
MLFKMFNDTTNITRRRKIIIFNLSNDLTIFLRQNQIVIKSLIKLIILFLNRMKNSVHESVSDKNV